MVNVSEGVTLTHHKLQMKLINVITATILLLAPVPAIAQNTAAPNVQPETIIVDITDSQVDAIYDLAGGEKQYREMVEWAIENISKNQIQAFDATIENGQYSQIVAAVEWLIQTYQAHASTNSSSEIVNARVKPAQTMSDTPFFWDN